MQLTELTDFLGFTDTKTKEADPAEAPSLDVEKLGKKKTLHKWEAPLRTPMKSFGGKIGKNLMIVAGVIGLLLLLIGEFFIILIIASIIFTGYILSATPSEEVEYEISTHGIDYVDQFYYWKELGPFFVTEEGDYPVLNINVKEKLPARLFLTLKKGEKEKVTELCQKYLPHLKEEPVTPFDKIYRKITSKLDI